MGPAPGRRGHGPELSYRPLAGVVPCPGGWFVAFGKLQGTTLFPDDGVVMESLLDVIDYRPSFDIVALAVPIGLPAPGARGGRTCDRQARALLGWPRLGAIQSAPPRQALDATTYKAARRAHPSLSSVTWGQIKRIREVADTIQPYHQRTVYEVHPELSFHQIADDEVLRYPKHTDEGRKERRVLLERRLPGVERLFRQVRGLRGATIDHAVDAAAALWTARRVAARAIVRMPLDPEWDDQGLRMELVR